MKKRQRVRQVEFGFTNWGGKRRGAGRKPKGEKAGVPHGKREALAARFPVLVTVKVRKGLPALRRKQSHRVFRQALEAGTERFGFRLVEYSLQTNHAHLLVEADDGRALSRGMQGLCVRISRALNKLWNRSGKVFADRFHSRILKTPREVRNALAYVLLNAQHHGIWASKGPDPYSSGESFDGWKDGESISAQSSSTLLGRARTWLLRSGWRRHGLLPWRQAPAGT